MSAPAKFMFDLDFAAPKASNTVPLADHQSKLAEAETRGYRNGFAAGQHEAAGENARRLALAMESIAHSLSMLTRGLANVELRVEAEAVEVAVATGRKLADALIAREPFAEIEALATGCFRELVTTPHVVVRLNDVLYAEAQLRLAGIARETGFDGRLLVLAEPDIAVGDCRIEWADGGMIRDRAAADAWIGETVRRFIDARAAPVQAELKGSDDE
ncbi:MAG: flagellar assembly protein FliH [Pseudorhodoplanes sp.]|uniref:FliH/SctL family protein n=1 Tax=Pseudorhodoplanes sp. TaxID=1934341 RepID=UPI003D149992